jgi:serine/threonine protein kinase
VLAADKANDVWACGTVLFAMLTAHPPVHSSGNQERTSGASSEAADDEATGKLVWPDNVQVSDACKNLLEVMLSPHPAERPTIHQILDHPWCAPLVVTGYDSYPIV